MKVSAQPSVDMKDFQAWKSEVVSGLNGGVRQLLKTAGVEVRQGFFRFTRGQTSNDSSIKEYLLATPPPYFEPARKIRNSNDDMGVKITLFQYQTCPFCCKARAFLDYFGLNYDVVEVNSVMRTQVLLLCSRQVAGHMPQAQQ